jgi:helicase MOV-10
VNSLCYWEHLPQPNFPVIFHGIQGENLQESISPSWYNIEEIELVLDYITKLDDVRDERLNIGIIAPYQKQVFKIKIALNRYNFHHKITVGSCEQFQGQENDVTIMSTVRSSIDYLQYDRTYNLGFVSNEKRFNVSITRAKKLLIIIGNPYVLCTDSNWLCLFNHCKLNNAYVGIEYDPPSNESDNNI